MNKNGEMGPCFEAALPGFYAKEMVDVFELVSIFVKITEQFENLSLNRNNALN